LVYIHHKASANRGINMLNNIGLFALGVALVCGLSYANSPTPDEQEWVEYCAMVKLHKNTFGRAGWPDFNGNGDECK